MKFLLLIFIVSFLSGCGEKPHDDSRFHPIRDQFVKDAKQFGIHADVSKVRISFDDLRAPMKILGFKVKSKIPDSTEGVCVYLERDVSNDLGKAFFKVSTSKSYDLMVIRIDKRLRHESAEYLESLVYHELGHCVLNLGHNDNESIMNTSGISRFGGFRYFLLKELFTHQPLETKELDYLRKGIKNLNVQLVYESNYVAFGKQLFHQLYYDQDQNKFFVSDDPDYVHDYEEFIESSKRN